MDWLFDKINLDHKIQIKYVDTKYQLADILTKGNFTRDEWNNLLHLFKISQFSLLCCSQNFSLTSCSKTMAIRMQEQEGKDRGKVKVDDEPRLHCLDKFFDCAESECVENLVILKASCRTDWSSSGKRDARNSNHDAASSSQG